MPRQGQEAKRPCTIIGIDISKTTLDIYRLSDGKRARFGNDAAGLKAMRKWLGRKPLRVVYEATGRYHRDLEAALASAGYANAMAAIDSRTGRSASPFVAFSTVSAA
ncbi:hypothetical protein [Amaricoccus sp. W119]|uniref:hypothetical protein n=1 Tax=Amaricoccus sp. W119 TaxID=3391833 RepID=UPI0039A67D19